MSKFIIAISRPLGSERDAFQQQLLRETAPKLLALEPPPSRLIVNLVDVAPPAGALVAAESPHDVVVEAWLDGREDLSAWAGQWLPSLGARTAWAWHVSERVQADDGVRAAPGERSPGVKTIYLVRRREALSDREAARRWREHAPLARRHHAGMAKYVQNGVVEALTPGAPLVHGIAELHFRTREDLEQRMYDSAEGRERIAADAAGLVAEALPLYTSEYVLRTAGPPAGGP